ncbi:MAG TPA: cyclic nucleotide-binding domain-containing protein [Geminicoccaceae bacterium]
MTALSVSPTLLVHLGFALSALGFLVRDILWLRLLAILGYSLFCLFQLTRAEGPAWDFVMWYATFMAINGGHAAWLIYERQLVRLNEEECRLRDLIFRALDPLAVKRLMRAGVWLDLPPGELMTREGRPARHVYAIAAGEARVIAAGTEIARIGPGRFVGEIGFLRAGPATATTLAAPPVEGEGPARLRCLAWPQRELRRRLARDDAMRTTLYAAIGTDLAAKIADDNVRITRPRAGRPRPG